jgi:predicted transport protein
VSLFKIDENATLKKIDRKEFTNEAELQKLIEKNLPYVMGIKLIASEYPIPNGRIDTLGIDEDDVPVIIEYKWKKDLSAIVQGLFYLNWIMQNKQPFESIVKDKIGKDISVNWSTQPRLIIIAQDFDTKELSAINLMGPSVELKKYSLYKNLFNIEDVNIVKGSKTIKPVNGDKKIEKYTLEQILNKAATENRDTFSILRDKILSISDAVWERVGSFYVDYRTSSTFVSIHIQKNKLKIYIKMGDQKLNDPNKICKEVPKSYGYGLLNTFFEVSRSEEINYAMKLINQAHNYVSD